MKKKILIGFAVLSLAFVAIFALNPGINRSDPSSLLLRNVEALADDEFGNVLPPVEITCSPYGEGDCWRPTYEGFTYKCVWAGNPRYYCKY